MLKDKVLGFLYNISIGEFVNFITKKVAEKFEKEYINKRMEIDILQIESNERIETRKQNLAKPDYCARCDKFMLGNPHDKGVEYKCNECKNRATVLIENVRTPDRNKMAARPAIKDYNPFA